MNMTNQDRLEKSYQDSERAKEILQAKPMFKKTVNEFRVKWNVPETGLKRGDKYLAWQQWLATTPRPSEVDLARETARQERIEKSTSSPLQEISGFSVVDHVEKPNPRRMLSNDIAQILIDHKLNPRWFRYMENYLLFNVDSRVPSGMEIQLAVDDDTGLEIIMLKITDEVAKPDIEAALATINKYQAKLPYKTRKKARIRDAYPKYTGVKSVYESKGMPAAITWLDKNYQKKSGEPHGYDDVYKMLGEYRSITENS